MKSGMKTRLTVALTALTMMLTIASPAMAQVNNPVQVTTGTLISILNNPNVNIEDVDVRVVDVDDSLNNNNVNVRALNNFLNNSLNNNNVEVLKDFLNNNQVDLTDVVDVFVEDNVLVLVVDVA